MADIHEHVAYLSQSIGPRPAGTEEEQQAALYITEQLQTDAGLPASIEDFNCNPDADLPRAICSALVILAGVLAIFVSMAVIPALIVALLATALFAAESLGKPVISRFFNRGVSQNVIAKYEPDFSPEAGGARRRKIVLVSHYDSGKVQPETSQPLLRALPLLAWASLGGMAVSIIVLVVRAMATLEGPAAIALNVVTALALLCAAWPLLLAILHRTSSYNEGANCNAAGVAVLLDVASRVGRGRVSAAELERMQEATIHGEEAARAAGLAPAGGELVYEAAVPQQEESAADRLLSAKAAVAALTGMPVSETINIDLPEEEPAPAPAPADPLAGLAVEGESAASAAGEPHEAATSSASAEGFASEEASEADAIEIEPEEKESSVPDWFRSAQQKAKKAEDREVAVQRSRYAEALDAAQLEQRPNRFSAPAETAISETEQRLQQMRESIMEVKAPGFRRADEASAPEGASAAAPSEPAEPSVAGEPEVADAAAGGSTVAFRPVPLDIPAVADVLGAAPKETPAAIFGDAVEDLRAQEGVTLREPRPLTGAQPASESAPNRAAMAESLAAAIPSIQTPAAALADKVPAVAASGKKPTRRKQRAITLPSIGEAADGLAPLDELSKQPAPLAEERPAATGRVRDLRAVLPSIGGAAAAGARSVQADALPSLSGALVTEEAPEEPSETSVSVAGAFSVAGSTGAFAPVGDELLENVDPDDRYVEDADDSDYEEVITETGAFSGPGYVDMPKSRASRLFGKFGFGRKKRQEETTPQEWLDVDDEFEAQAAGAARGGWESFREDDDYDDADAYYDDYEDDEEGEVYEALYEEDDSAPRGAHGAPSRWNGGSFSREQLGRVSTLSEDVRPEQPADLEPDADDLDGIYRFRNPEINTEVWFVALGAELAGNGGMNAFLDEHAQELRGAIFIDLDALGAGELTLIEREGTYLPRQASSRMRRLVKKASSAVGLSVGAGTMLWTDSAAACAMRRGCQTMHLAGMENGKPAHYGQSDDVVENVSGEVMHANADFIMELLKSI